MKLTPEGPGRFICLGWATNVIILGIIIYAVAIGFGAYGLFYIVAALWFTDWFVRNISLGRREFRLRRDTLRNNNSDRWWDMPVALLTWICVGRVIYCATYAVTWAIPLDWGWPGEDGDWTSTRTAVQFIIAFFGSYSLIDVIEKNALTLTQGDSTSLDSD